MTRWCAELVNGLVGEEHGELGGYGRQKKTVGDCNYAWEQNTGWVFGPISICEGK